MKSNLVMKNQIIMIIETNALLRNRETIYNCTMVTPEPPSTKSPSRNETTD